MTRQIQVGSLCVQVSDDVSINIKYPPEVQPVKAEKPEIPEPLEARPYIYRPNDFFQHAIDSARAIASITAAHQPWVKKTWFICFLVIPLVGGEALALASLLEDNNAHGWKNFTGVNIAVLPFWLIHYSIWRRKVKGLAQA